MPRRDPDKQVGVGLHLGQHLGLLPHEVPEHQIMDILELGISVGISVGIVLHHHNTCTGPYYGRPTALVHYCHCAY